MTEATFVAPMSSATFATPGKVTGLVSWKIINDFGGVGKSHTQVR
ncbi:fimbrial biogenesis chaperone [Klebsiella michiganensis]|nr:hypothetical protein [Klebsiella michiganensis]